jgi:hypothetical protein
MLKLSTREDRFLQLLERVYPRNGHRLESWLASIDSAHYAAQPGIGKKKVRMLDELKRRIDFAPPDLPDTLLDGETRCSGHKTHKIASKVDFETLHRNGPLADRVTSQAVMTYFESLPQIKKQIFAQYYDIKLEKIYDTRELMKIFGVSESRISQLRSEVRTSLYSISPFERAHAEQALSFLIGVNLTNYFSSTSELIRGHRGLYRLVNTLFGFDADSLMSGTSEEHSFTHRDLNNIFANSMFPISLLNFFMLLHADYGVSKFDYWKIINDLQHTDKIKLNGDSIVWACIDSQSAIANISLRYPQGRAAKDLYNEYSSSVLYRGSTSTSNDGHYRQVTKNSYLYALRKGVYRNRRFFSLPESSANQIRGVLARYAGMDACPDLPSIYKAESTLWIVSEYDFVEFTTREVESNRFRLHFESNSDFDRQETLLNRICAFIRDSDRSVSKDEIITFLEHYGDGYISRLINQLINCGRIARVSQRYYDLAENAINEQKAAVICQALRVLIGEDMQAIFEAQHLSEQLHNKFGLAINKHLLVFVTNRFMKNEVNTVRFLISRQKIEFKSLLDIVRDIARSCEDSSQLKNAIKSRINISDSVLNGFLSTWIAAHSDELQFSQKFSNIESPHLKHAIDVSRDICHHAKLNTVGRAILFLSDNNLRCAQIRSMLLNENVDSQILGKISVHTIREWLKSLNLTIKTWENIDNSHIRTIASELSLFSRVYADHESPQLFHFFAKTIAFASTELIELRLNTFNVIPKKCIFDSISQLVDAISNAIIQNESSVATPTSYQDPLIVQLCNCEKSILLELCTALSEKSLTGIRYWHRHSNKPYEVVRPNIILLMEAETQPPKSWNIIRAYPSRIYSNKGALLLPA